MAGRGRCVTAPRRHGNRRPARRPVRTAPGSGARGLPEARWGLRRESGQRAAPRLCEPPPPHTHTPAPREGAPLGWDAGKASGSGARPSKAEKPAAFPLLSAAAPAGAGRRTGALPCSGDSCGWPVGEKAAFLLSSTGAGFGRRAAGPRGPCSPPAGHREERRGLVLGERK